MKWGNERKHTLGRVQQRRSRAEVEQLVDAFESSGFAAARILPEA